MIESNGWCVCRFYDPLIGVLDRKTYTSWYLPSFDLKASFPDDLGTPSFYSASDTQALKSRSLCKVACNREACLCAYGGSAK